MKTKNGRNFYLGILVAFFVVLAWSGYRPPAGGFTWFLEVFPALLALIILASSIKKFEFTKLVYVLLLFHSFILMVGGHTTYSQKAGFYLVLGEVWFILKKTDLAAQV